MLRSGAGPVPARHETGPIAMGPEVLLNVLEGGFHTSSGRNFGGPEPAVTHSSPLEAWTQRQDFWVSGGMASEGGTSVCPKGDHQEKCGSGCPCSCLDLPSGKPCASLANYRCDYLK
jgi:hypothetical protein